MFLYLYGNNKVAAYKTTVRKEKNIFCIELDETLLVFPSLKNSMKKFGNFTLQQSERLSSMHWHTFILVKMIFNSVPMSLLQLNSAITKKCCYKPKC